MKKDRNKATTQNNFVHVGNGKLFETKHNTWLIISWLGVVFCKYILLMTGAILTDAKTNIKWVQVN